MSKENPPIDNLFAGEKERVLDIVEKIKNGSASKRDLGTLVRIAQQNHWAFTTFQLSLLLRLAEIDFSGRNILDSYQYIKENVFAAFDLPEHLFFNK